MIRSRRLDDLGFCLHPREENQANNLVQLRE